MVNRAVLLLRYKEPFIEWLNASDPYGNDQNINVEEANQDKIVYLIDETEAENLEEYISSNFRALFESELDGWYEDESLWPKKRDLATFLEWFTVECHTMVLDAGIGPIVDELE